MLRGQVRADGRRRSVEQDDDDVTQTGRNETNESIDDAEQWEQKSAVERQMLYCELLGNRIWNKYSENELQRVIAFALFGPPKLKTGEDLLSGYSERQKKDTIKLYKIIAEHVSSKNEIHLSVIFVICETAKGERFDVPVFRIRKCVPRQEFDIDLGQEVNMLELYMDCCVLFIDIEGRTYKSWLQFLSNVRLPKCKMIFPSKGFYVQSRWGSALRQRMSPECSVGAKVKRGIYHTGSAATITSAAVLTAAAIPAVTIAPVVVTSAVIVGIGAGITAAVSGVMTIVDRVRHRQTVAPTNLESINAYISIGGGVLGASQTVFARTLSKAAQEGIIIKEAVKQTYNVVCGLNLAVNGVGVASIGYSGVNRLITEKRVSPEEVFQFTASLLFFTGTVVSLKSANTIISEAQASASITQKTKNILFNGGKGAFTENVREIFKVNDNVINSKTEQDKMSVSPLEYARVGWCMKTLISNNATFSSILNRVQDRLLETLEKIIVNGVSPNIDNIKEIIVVMICPITDFIADFIVDILAYIMENVRRQPIFNYINQLYGTNTSVPVVVLEFIREFLLKTAKEFAIEISQTTENSSVKRMTKAVELFCTDGSLSAVKSRIIVRKFEDYICTKMAAFVIEKTKLKNKYKKCEHCRMGYYIQ